MICQDCGWENPDEFKFCSRCGREVLKPIPLGDSMLKEYRVRVRKAIAQRDSTDLVISPLWVILLTGFVIVVEIIAVIMIIVAVIDMVNQNPGGSFTYADAVDLARPAINVLTVQAIVYGISLSVLTFLMVMRLRKHITRDSALRLSIRDLLKESAGSPNRQKMLEDRHSAIMESESMPWQLSYPILWAMIPLIPIVAMLYELRFLDTHTILNQSDLRPSTYITYMLTGLSIILNLYLFFFLGKAIASHDVSWSTFAQDSRLAMTELGLPHARQFDVGVIPKRSFWLYAVLSLVTLGFWSYFWWYTIVKDPNTHFEKQWGFEDHLTEVLDKSERDPGVT